MDYTNHVLLGCNSLNLYTVEIYDEDGQVVGVVNLHKPTETDRDDNNHPTVFELSARFDTKVSIPKGGAIALRRKIQPNHL